MTSRSVTVSRVISTLALQTRAMATRNEAPIYFGPFEVTPQVFHKTPFSFALVNLKPLLPGHVLVSPLRVVPRLTDLTTPEISDLFATVQKVEHMLASTYFGDKNSSQLKHGSGERAKAVSVQEVSSKTGSFNIAVQDGPDAGQSVAHVHCHIIPRLGGNQDGDKVYDWLAGEEGNVGGALWDRQQAARPRTGGEFPKIEDADRRARSKEEMAEEARYFRGEMEKLGY